MRPKVKSGIGTVLKIAVAVFGLWYVTHLISWNDQATLAPGQEINAVAFPDGLTVDVLGSETIPGAGTPTAPVAGQTHRVYHVRFTGRATKMTVNTPAGPKTVMGVPGSGATVDGVALDDQREKYIPEDRFQKSKDGLIVHYGLGHLVQECRKRWYDMALALLVLGLPFALTAWRWQKLMEPQGVHLPYSKCVALTFVGQFYSTFLPGTTSGDVVKIIYTSKVIGSTTKSTITVLLDRAIGLIALVFIAGVAGAMQLGNPTMRNVALLVAGILGGLAAGATVYFSKRLRRRLGLEYLLEHSKLPEFIKHADESLHVYRGHFGLLGWAFAVSVAAQMLAPLSAWLAGESIGIPASFETYMAYVPIAILAAALPISFLGLGVMDGIILHFFHDRADATTSQAFALAQAIRFLPVLWNLLGAYWVVRGDYSRHAPTPEEDAEVKEEANLAAIGVRPIEPV